MNAGQLILTVITAVAAIAAAALSWWAGRQATGQREHQARREEWWRRFQWATDLSLSDDGGKIRVGQALLTVLADSPLATQDELDAIAAVSDQIFQVFTEQRTGREDDDGTDTTSVHRREPTMGKPVPRTVTMAAQLRVKVDNKRGVETPDVISRLAHATEYTDDDVRELREAITVR